jgi:uncharacterized protein YbaP (TraB family)
LEVWKPPPYIRRSTSVGKGGAKLFKSLKRFLALVGIASAAWAAPQAAAPAAHPALWEVSDPDTTIYLFGTIHLLPPNYKWRTPKLDQAIAESDSLYVETIVDPSHPEGIRNALATLDRSQGLPPIADRVDPSHRPLLETAIAKSGMPRPAFDRMETWAAAFRLLGVQFAQIGLQGEAGVEQTLKDSFAARGKPIGELETNAQQLAFFDVLPEKAQRALLEGSIQPPAAAGKDFDEMIRGWASGDVEAIARTFNQDLADSPALKETLLERRNANWAQWIERRLQQPGTVMIAVGAGHLAGPDSVISLLKRQGYRVKRVQ